MTNIISPLREHLDLLYANEKEFVEDNSLESRDFCSLRLLEQNRNHQRLTNLILINILELLESKLL